MRVAIVDYGMGNIKSIISSLNYIGVNEVFISNDYLELKSADKLILPGVGSYGNAISILRNKKIDLYLNEFVLENKKPILGICLGMQLMGVSSNEDGINEGLKFINGVVTKFDSSISKVPHVGFNQVKLKKNTKLYDGFSNDTLDFYFTHSYKMDCFSNVNQSYCNYQNDFVASFEFENIAGTQFHPELSQNIGLRVLENFINHF
jgi:glutamine amidotransferase